MSEYRTSDRVVNLSEYRAAKAAAMMAATASKTAPARYLLWYPGLGYVQVAPGVAVVAPSGLPVSRN